MSTLKYIKDTVYMTVQLHNVAADVCHRFFPFYSWIIELWLETFILVHKMSICAQ